MHVLLFNRASVSGYEVSDILSHKIGCGKAAVRKNRVEAMEHYRKPKSQKDMPAFLGAIGYHR